MKTKIPEQFSVGLVNDKLQIKHIRTGIDFAFIPGGTYDKGLSDAEYSLVCGLNDHEFDGIDLDDLRNVSKCETKSFLVSEYPISWQTLSRFYPEYSEYKGCAWLDKDTIDRICADLNFKLITDDEWEYMARCGKSQLFPFGNTIPTDENELEKWLVTDYDKSDMNCNELGIYGLFRGEWTSTLYNINEQEYYCIRGGASNFWPWQDSGEWLSCICAYRMSSEGLFEDKSAAFRFVCDTKK